MKEWTESLMLKTLNFINVNYTNNIQLFFSYYHLLYVAPTIDDIIAKFSFDTMQHAATANFLKEFISRFY